MEKIVSYGVTLNTTLGLGISYWQSQQVETQRLLEAQRIKNKSIPDRVSLNKKEHTSEMINNPQYYSSYKNEILAALEKEPYSPETILPSTFQNMSVYDSSNE